MLALGSGCLNLVKLVSDVIKMFGYLWISPVLLGQGRGGVSNKEACHEFEAVSMTLFKGSL